eukprot:6254136-Alexandrium_andersonii.AAC.1
MVMVVEVMIVMAMMRAAMMANPKNRLGQGPRSSRRTQSAPLLALRSWSSTAVRAEGGGDGDSST